MPIRLPNVVKACLLAPRVAATAIGERHGSVGQHFQHALPVGPAPGLLLSHLHTRDNIGPAW